MQDIDNNESNLSEIQKRLFFLKNLERLFIGSTSIIEKRDQLRTYFLKNDEDHEIRNLRSN